MQNENKKKDEESGAVLAIVETPRGCRNKYKLNEETGGYKLSKVMPEGMAFPYDFGFFPDTRSGDGDPLDVLILSDESTFPGCEIDCRLAGVIFARQRAKGQEEKRNDRIVAVAEASVLYASVRELTDIEPKVLEQVEQFFVNYQKVRQVEIELLGRGDSRAAMELLENSREKKRR